MNTRKPLKLGPIELETGVTRLNAGTFLYAAFFSISLVSILNFLQAYIITQHLLIPADQQGAISGDLQVWNEIVAVLLVVPLGARSDRPLIILIIIAQMLYLSIRLLGCGSHSPCHRQSL